MLLCTQQVELREVRLNNKPRQMILASAKATVPVLCLPDGRVIDESLEIMQWAIDAGKKTQQLCGMGNSKQCQLDLINDNDHMFKPWLDRYKYHVRYPEHPLEHYRYNAEQFLAVLEARLNSTTYLFGPHPQLADLAIMPFVRQFAGVDRQWFDDSQYASVRGWLAGWLDSGVFKSAMVNYPVWSAEQQAIIFGNPD